MVQGFFGGFVGSPRDFLGLGFCPIRSSRSLEILSTPPPPGGGALMNTCILYKGWRLQMHVAEKVNMVDLTSSNLQRKVMLRIDFVSLDQKLNPFMLMREIL